MKKTLENASEQHFKSFSLSPKQLEKLGAMEQLYGSKRSRISNKMRVFWSFSALVAGLFVVFITLPEKENIDPDIIANEIAYNHNKTLSMEFKGKSFNEIKPHFSKLDFNLVPSNRKNLSELNLVGGRYISINKHLAAQIQLIRNGKDKKDIKTWYQLSLPKNGTVLSRDPFQNELEVYSNGVKIIMWKEKGVLHGIAEKP